MCYCRPWDFQFCGKVRRCMEDLTSGIQGADRPLWTHGGVFHNFVSLRRYCGQKSAKKCHFTLSSTLGQYVQKCDFQPWDFQFCGKVCSGMGDLTSGIQGTDMPL